MGSLKAQTDSTGLLEAGWMPRDRKRALRQSLIKEHDWFPLLRQTRLQVEPADRLLLLYGHPLVPKVALSAMTDHVLSGQPVVYLDGAHTFDPFVIGRVARSRRQPPRKALAMMHVARAFSWHQLERLISTCLADALDRYEAGTAVISGLFEALAEETASERELARSMERLLESIARLKSRGHTLLCLCPSVPMPETPGHALFIKLRDLADRAVRVQELLGNVTLSEEMSRPPGLEGERR